ncbi:MAG TPA: universal stress protein [Burkholderiales bacterium]|nr:universal stress protein [Burkholderiales bacterium]
MYRNILVPTDGSATAEKAVVAGIDYAREAGARVLFFTAVPEYRVPGEAELMARQGTPLHEYERQARAAAAAILEKAARRAREANVAFQTDYALSDRPAAAIVESARQHGCDAIFMATHGRTGWSALVHGSETHDVLVSSDIPTFVYR